MVTALRFLTLGLAAFAGCSRTPPTPPPSPAEQREFDQLNSNATEATRLFESGAIHAGQDVYEFLKLCKPYRVDFVDRFVFIEFYEVPNLHGLSVIAIDGKLVSAASWSCVSNEVFFRTITQEELAAAHTAYEPRVFGYQR